MKHNGAHRLATFLIIPAMLFAACVAVSAAQAATASQPTRAQLIARVPASLRPLYAGAPDPIYPSAYANFKAVPTPWKICFSDAYEGNAWRIRARDILQLLNSQFHKAGLTQASVYVAVSNNSIPDQLAQIRTMIDQKCSVILSFLGSTEGFDSVIQEAYQHGIPFIAGAGSPPSPYSENANSNWNLMGAQGAQAIINQLKGKGNVVMVEGIAGSPVATGENDGALAVFKKYPGIHVIAQVNGNWTPSVAKTAMLTVLATHPESIGAVWSTGGAFNVVGEAFEQSHRSLPQIITSAGNGVEVGWWHANQTKVKGFMSAVEPDMAAQQMFRIGVRILEGQHPVINTEMEALPPITSANLDSWWKACITPTNASTFPVPPTDPLPESILNQFFTNGKSTAPYNYATASLPPC
jgi:ribose transport system substrate-binding protein